MMTSMTDRPSFDHTITKYLNSKHKSQPKPFIQVWNENVTVPQPFSLSNDVNKKKSKVVIELEEKRMREKILEELECQKQFKAHSVPSFVSTPLYDQIVKHNEERKKLTKAKNKEKFQTLVKPFSFSEKNETKSKTQVEKTTNNLFKANPFPSKIFTSEIDLKMQDKEMKRAFAKNLRSKTLLKHSEAPKAIVEHEHRLEEKKKKCVKGIMFDFIQEELNKFHPKIHRDVPDFDHLYTQFLYRKFKISDKLATKCEPFHFETEARKKQQTKQSERRASSASLSNFKNLNLRSASSASLFPPSMDTIPITETKTSVLRAEKARILNERTRNLIDLGLKQMQMKKLQNKVLQKTVREKSIVHDLNFIRASVEEKVKNQKVSEQERVMQYKKEISKMQERITNRPLLFEQIAEMNAKLQAEKKHANILEKNKVDISFVQNKSEVTNENVDDQAIVAKESAELDHDGSESMRQNTHKNADPDESNTYKSRSSSYDIKQNGISKETDLDPKKSDRSSQPSKTNILMKSYLRNEQRNNQSVVELHSSTSSQHSQQLTSDEEQDDTIYDDAEDDGDSSGDDTNIEEDSVAEDDVYDDHNN